MTSNTLGTTAGNAGELKTTVVCPYCAAGCKMQLVTKNGKIIRSEAADGQTNRGELCLKGYYGWDFLYDTRRLTARLKNPLIRRKRGEEFQECSWDEALDFIAKRLTDIKAKYGPRSIYLTGSSRGTGNETNYVQQKFARAAIGTNNVDCCVRVCHAASVSGLQMTLGYGAMSNSMAGDIDNTKCVFVFGYNGAASHPVIAKRVINAKHNGAKVVVCDPRRIETARIADQYVRIKNGTNIAVVNAFIYTILEEKLYDADYVAKHTHDFDKLAAKVKDYAPEKIEDITGIPAADLRRAIRTYAEAESAIIMWGMGVTQHPQGVDTVRSLATIALLTGNLGRPNVGVFPMRGQNNVQGGCDMGVIPDFFPGYQRVTDAKVREKFAKAWNIDPKNMMAEEGYRLTEVPRLALEGKMKAYYIMGEDPLQTEADLGEVREGFEKLELIVVQDIFMTKTAEAADVVLPSTSWGEHSGVFTCADRGFQRFFKAVEPLYPNVRRDWDIISDLSTRMGYPMSYKNEQEIWDEMRSLCPLFEGATYELMGEMGHVQWPIAKGDKVGTSVMYKEKFNTPDGKVALFATEWLKPVEAPNKDYPMVLCTVREVGHYSCRSMTGNCSALETLADEPGYCQINSEDAAALGIKSEQLVWVSSRRGKVISRAHVSERINKGAIYMTYQWWIGACNELTQENLDPISRTPNTKYCAAKLETIADQSWAEEYAASAYTDMKIRLCNHVDNAEKKSKASAA